MEISIKICKALLHLGKYAQLGGEVTNESKFL